MPNQSRVPTHLYHLAHLNQRKLRILQITRQTAKSNRYFNPIQQVPPVPRILRSTPTHWLWPRLVESLNENTCQPRTCPSLVWCPPTNQRLANIIAGRRLDDSGVDLYWESWASISQPPPQELTSLVAVLLTLNGGGGPCWSLVVLVALFEPAVVFQLLSGVAKNRGYD